MTSQSERTDRDIPSRSPCWCCGSTYPEQQLSRLGEHPEVAVCAQCARWLHRRAEQRHDENHPTVAARLRGAVRAARGAVLRRGWHQRPSIGRLLRRLDRHLP